MSNTASTTTTSSTTTAQATSNDHGTSAGVTATEASIASSFFPADAAAAGGEPSGGSAPAADSSNAFSFQTAPLSADDQAALAAASVAAYRLTNRGHEAELNAILMELWLTRRRLTAEGYDLLHQRMRDGSDFPPAVKTLLDALALVAFYRQEVLWDLLATDADWKNVKLAEEERVERAVGMGLGEEDFDVWG